MLNKHPLFQYLLLGIFFLALSGLGLFVDRHQSYLLMVTFGASCVAYIFLVQQGESATWLFVTGLTVRLLLFFSLPGLSDDLYRFIWDGTLLKNGIHPFENLPSYYLNQQITGIDQELYDRLNSPSYFTIYPPLNQLIFWLSALIGNGNWLVSAGVIRLFLLAADLGSFWFLRKLLIHYGKSENLAFWYFLNPLVILEFVGNVHFEGLVVCFTLTGIYWFETSKKWLSASALGLAIGTKLLPLIYLPYFFLKGLKDKRWMISILAGVIAFATLLPLLNEPFIRGMQSSLDLYFRRFEFNASIYYIAREIGYLMYGYNNIAQIGPALSLVSLLTILIISIVAIFKNWSIPKTLLFILTAYLLLSTTVHPWYILPLVAFGILSGYFYPIIWSFFIFITYIGYTETGYRLPLHWVTFEYLLVFITIFTEFFKTTDYYRTSL